MSAPTKCDTCGARGTFAISAPCAMQCGGTMHYDPAAPNIAAWIQALPPDAIAQVVDAYRDVYESDPSECHRKTYPIAAAQAFRDALLSLARVQLSEERPEPCNCKFSDAWRCAVDRRLSSVSCHCRCHAAVRDVDSLRPPEALEMFAVTRREAIWAIWPRRVQAEAYQSGFSLPVETSIETVRVLRGADSVAAPEEKK